MMYTVDEIGEDFVVVNGERLEVDPPFETLPDKQDYENWLNEVMTWGRVRACELLERTWASVKQRDWARNPETCHDETERSA